MAGGEGFVAVFDSGLGGISVLRRLVDALPHEDFVYVGDSAHNPYGERSPRQILSLSRQIVWARFFQASLLSDIRLHQCASQPGQQE